jgi:hypothetical protein
MFKEKNMSHEEEIKALEEEIEKLRSTKKEVKESFHTCPIFKVRF